MSVGQGRVRAGDPIVEVTEYTDPGCIWSWSSEPRLRSLRARYGTSLRWRRVFGIQIDDTARTHPGLGPKALAGTLLAYWQEAARLTGAPVTSQLAWPLRSTIPASRAARAAELQGAEVAERVLRRLREAQFVHGRPADTEPRILRSLLGVDGLDAEQLRVDLEGHGVAASLARDAEEARHPLSEVIGLEGPGPNPGAARSDGSRMRYGFPTLIFRGPSRRRVVPGWRSPEEDDAAIAFVAPGLEPSAPLPLDPELALERYRTLTGKDLRLLTGGVPPRNAVFVPTPTGPIWFLPEEAAAAGIVRDTGTAPGHRHGSSISVAGREGLGATSAHDHPAAAARNR